MTGGFAPELSTDLVARIEGHSVYAWPAQVVELTEDGWVLRATPGLERGRSNHALTPCRTLTDREIDSGLARAAEFARQQGIDLGLQVSPIELQIGVLERLSVLGWDIQTSVQVLVAPIAAVADDALELVVTDHADEDWLRAWAVCEPNRAAGGPGLDVESHIRTVFPLMAGRARFCRHGDLAVGIGVDMGGICGLFCLAVAPHARRQGLGKALVRSILAGSDSALTYLQVFSENVPGLALYNSLGFTEAYRYCHAVAPAPVAAAES